MPTKKSPKSVSLKSLKKSADKVHAANDTLRRMPKGQPHEDVNQAAFRVVTELTKDK